MFDEIVPSEKSEKNGPAGIINNKHISIFTLHSFKSDHCMNIYVLFIASDKTHLPQLVKWCLLMKVSAQKAQAQN